MKIEIVKGIILVSLFFVTLLFSMLPLIAIEKIRNIANPARRHSYEHIISILSCFGGGVFLGTCFLDLFPDVQAQLQDVWKDDKNLSSYPFAEFVMIFGFLLVLIIEQIVLSYKESRPELEPLLSHSHTTQNEEESDHHLHRVHNNSVSYTSLRTLLLVFALSLHSIFEGLAIGLQTTMNNILQIFIAVTIHKGILAFTLGLNLIQSKLNLITCIICNCLFSIMSPMGIGIAIVITDLGTSREISLTSGILQGIACGSFLYVTFFEVLPHELNGSFSRLLKLLFVILGFAGISIIVGFYQ